jgi:hypothetical protein
MKAKVIYRDASIRGGPSVSFESLGQLPVGTIVEYSEVVREQPGVREWIKISTGAFTGKYINSLYPDSEGTPVPRVEFISASVPGKPRVNFAVVNYTDETGTHEVKLYPK